MNILIKNIKSLLQVEEEPKKWSAGKEMALLKTLENSWLLLSGGKITDFGSMKDRNWEIISANNTRARTINAEGRIVMPAFCDPHTIWFMPEAGRKSL